MDAPDPNARDADKLIRQLSLVAFLMAERGRKVDALTIHRRVEGYGGTDRNLESFSRRFYADRDELAALGIEIEHERGGDGDLYWLPRENYFFPPVEFSAAELAALNACLSLLDGQFPYSRVLRLALQGLTLGTESEAPEDLPLPLSLDLPSSGYDSEVSARQAEIERNVARRKTVRFEYYSASSRSTGERIVDPYGMVSTGGDWYLVGHDHAHDEIRIFKLRRIRGRIRQLSKSDHNYEIPEEFDLRDYFRLAPWQLGPTVGEATIRFSSRLGWLAANTLDRYGEIEMDGRGSAVLRTSYSDPEALCALVLGNQPGASIEIPRELRNKMTSLLADIRHEHEGTAPAVPPPGKTNTKVVGGASSRGSGGATPGGADRSLASQVQPERFALVATTLSFLLQRLGEEEQISLSAAEVMHDLGFSTRRELSQALDLLRIVSIGEGGYLIEAYLRGDEVLVTGWPEGESFRRPAHLSPREATALLLAIDLVGGHLLTGGYEALARAREKVQRATRGTVSPSAVIGETGKEDYRLCEAVNRALTEHRLVEIEYLSQRSAQPQRRVIEPYIVIKSKGRTYLAAWCRNAGGMRTFRYEMIKSTRLLDDSFEPRPERETGLGRYLSDPLHPSGTTAPHVAEVLFSAGVAPWASERYEDVTALEDGSALARIPFFDDEWLVSEVLRYGGNAVLVSPEDRRPLVVAAAQRIAAEYD